VIAGKCVGGMNLTGQLFIGYWSGIQNTAQHYQRFTGRVNPNATTAARKQ